MVHGTDFLNILLHRLMSLHLIVTNHFLHYYILYFVKKNTYVTSQLFRNNLLRPISRHFCLIIVPIVISANEPCNFEYI